MSNKTSYMTSVSATTNPNKIRHTFTGFLLGSMAVLVVLLSTVGGISVANSQKAEAFDIDQWIMCSLIGDETAKTIYQMTQTADIPFILRSKSAVSSGVSNVGSGFNWLLEVSGHDFASINESILGYTVETNGIEESLTEDEYKERHNKGQYVNPFDRFGVAGLKYSAYMGEWKYFIVDACSSSGEPQDPKAGLFYPERLEPRSTWDDRGNSIDPRTEQFNKGIISQFFINATNTVSNGIFNITKTIVTLSLAFINFSFADITSIMGLDDLIGAEGGVFDSLFSGIFSPLVFLMFILTAGNIFYMGIVKRQYRSALTSLIRSLVLFIAAIVIAAAPAFFISLPNNTAVVVQSAILVSMNESITGGDQLCATDVGQIESEIVENTNANDIDILEQASKNIRSVVGCQFWQSFLLKPWAEGQFGTDWNKLWANENIPGWADNGESIGNTNEAMVGTAEVPLGGSKSIHNWAIYHLSTQTNVHSPTNLEGQRSKYTSGVANDWWRIVDALSNYDEKDFTDVIGDGISVKYDVPTGDAVTENWDKWTGNSIMSRVGVSMTSVVVAGVGVLAPLLFAAMSLMYTVGLAILMAFAPIMLLLGCWATKGWEIFKGWGELVINTVMKRIATGLMLTISISFTSSILEMTDTLSWWRIVALLILVSVLLIKARKQIMDILASFKFAEVDLSGTASKVAKKSQDITVKPIKATGKFAGSTVMGGIAAKRSGVSFGTGMMAGARNEIKNFGYRNQMMRDTISSYELHKSNSGEDVLNGNVCATCGKVLDYETEQGGTGVFHGGRDADGNLICNECTMDGVNPDAEEVVFYRTTAKEKSSKRRKKDIKQQKMYRVFQSKFSDKSVLTNTKSQKLVDAIEGGDIDVTSGTPMADREKMLIELMKGINMDVNKHKSMSVKTEGGAKMVATPEIPPEIEQYVDRTCLETAWDDQQYDYITMTYIAGYISWYQDVVDLKFSEDLNDVFEEIVGKKKKKVVPDGQEGFDNEGDAQ